MADLNVEGQSPDLASSDSQTKDKAEVPIPVCTLFNNPTNEEDSFSQNTVSQTNPSVKETAVEPTIQEPILCDVFKSNAQPTDDDIFSNLGEKPMQSEPNSTQKMGRSSSPSDMEDLKFVPSVESFIIDDLVENKEVEVDDSNENQTLQEKSEGLENDHNTTLKNSQSFVSINSFTISPEEAMDQPLSEENDPALALEKLSLNDSPNNREDVGKTEDEVPESKNVLSSEINESVSEIPNAFTNENKPDTTQTYSPAKNLENMEKTSSNPIFFSENVDRSGLFDSPERHSIFTDEDDPFAAALSSSELDRRRDAWIPSSPSTVTILNAVISNQRTIQLEVEKLTRPRLASSEVLEDPVKEFVTRMTGSETILKRQNLTVTDVCQNKEGVKQLIDTGNLRAAANLCAKLLEGAGQGFGESSPITSNTSETLQLWLCRIFVLTKLKLFDMAQTELEPFKDLENPDMFYEFYPELHPGRRGSMVPFAFRLLYAGFPGQTNNPQESLKRLHKLLNVCTKILKNLNEEKNEIGEVSKLNSADKDLSTKFWSSRKIRVLYAISNTLMQLNEYDLVVETLDEIMLLRPENGPQLQSDIGRVFLHMGDIREAQLRFTEAEKLGLNDAKYKLQLILNKGFMYIGTNNWKEAYTQFEMASNLEPTNIVALNNKAVCLLYLGKLKGAIAVLENGISDPGVFEKDSDMCWQQSMAQGLVSNLSTLYELESSRYVTKKRTLFLKHIAPSCGDGFDTTCLKEI